MKDFTYVCANCKAEQTVYVEHIGSFANTDQKKLKTLLDNEIQLWKWVKMNESDVIGFHDFLCPKCQ